MLLKHKLLHHENVKYDGYRLTNLGYDYLAIKTFVNRGLIVGMGRQIGVGKESDIFEVLTEDNETLCLKLHRLGRTSFRDVKSKRDYLGHRRSYGSWLYLSRLAALKEFAFMRALHENDFPVPTPVDVNRHAVLMGKVNAHPMVNVRQIQNPGKVYDVCMSHIQRLAEHGLIHGDFNEFNLMIGDDEKITIIDFPQMVSIQHKNARYYFERDVDCVKVFFNRKFHFSAEEHEDTAPSFDDLNFDDENNLDRKVAASGFDSKRKEEFERLSVALTVPEEDEEGEDDDGEGSADESDNEINEDMCALEVSEEVNHNDSEEDEDEGNEEQCTDDDTGTAADDGTHQRLTGARPPRVREGVESRVTKQHRSTRAKAKKTLTKRNVSKSKNAGKRKGAMYD